MNKTVLILEDDPDISVLVKKAFETDGFTVHLSEDIKSALALLSKNKISLLFADVILKDGKSLDYINDFMDLRPELKIIITSGYYEFISRIRLDSNISFVIKPYEIKKVLALANSLLSER